MAARRKNPDELHHPQDYEGPQIDPMSLSEKDRIKKDPNWRREGEVALTIGLERAGELLAGCGDPKVLADLLKVVSEIVGTGLVIGPKNSLRSKHATDDDDSDEI